MSASEMKMEYETVKLEPLSTYPCQCCSSNVDYYTDTDYSSYAYLIFSCFSIQIATHHDVENSRFVVCETCIKKLKDSYDFKYLIEETQWKLTNVNVLGDPHNSSRQEIKFDINNKSSKLYQDESKSSESTSFDSTYDRPDCTVNISTLDESDTNENNNRRSRKQRKCGIKKDNRIKKDHYCDLCQKLFVSRKQLIIHKKRHSLNLAKKLDSIESQLENVSDGENEKSTDALTCNICEKSFKSDRLLNIHISENHQNFECNICPKVYNRLSYLKAHQKKHPTELSTCSVCNKTMKTSSLCRHMSLHNGDNKRHRCPHCKERFSSLDQRLKHTRDEHGVDIYKYACGQCPKKFFLASRLKVHVKKNHTCETNKVCHVCGYKCFGASNLISHMVKHTGEKKFPCTVCAKSFCRKKTLTEHMKIHKNIRAFKCDVCDKTFIQKCSLKGHLKVHGRTFVEPDGVPQSKI